MHFSIHQFSDPDFDFECFETKGYRDDKGSHILDAMKYASDMGYSSSHWFSEPFILETEYGKRYLVVNPRTHPDWAEEMEKDLAHIQR